jgi:hypothetical protein
MPYISQEKADRLDQWTVANSPVTITTAGELGYVIARAVRAFLEDKTYYDKDKALRYQYVCDAIGTLESIKLDLWARIGEPYERNVERENDTFHWNDPLA